MLSLFPQPFSGHAIPTNRPAHVYAVLVSCLFNGDGRGKALPGAPRGETNELCTRNGFEIIKPLVTILRGQFCAVCPQLSTTARTRNAQFPPPSRFLTPAAAPNPFPLLLGCGGRYNHPKLFGLDPYLRAIPAPPPYSFPNLNYVGTNRRQSRYTMHVQAAEKQLFQGGDTTTSRRGVDCRHRHR